MKVSLKQLKRAINTLERECLYSDSSYDDTEVEIECVDADPGNGKIVDVFTLAATASDQYKERNAVMHENVKIEVFPKHEKMDPVITIELSKKLTR